MGAQARTLGPWSSARQLAEGRGAAAAAREDRIRDSAAAAVAAAAGAAALAWSPRRDFRRGPAPARRVPSLVALCVDLVVQHLEDVDTLWGLADVIRARPAAAAPRRAAPCRRPAPPGRARARADRLSRRPRATPPGRALRLAVPCLLQQHGGAGPACTRREGQAPRGRRGRPPPGAAG
jgi:hypothetical protein